MYICLTRRDAKNYKFKILPRHPLNMDECTLMDYNEGFKAIDWDTMKCKGRDDEYAKQVKMAECLTHCRVPVEYFHIIYVKDEESKNIVEEKLKEYGITKKPPYINIMPWV